MSFFYVDIHTHRQQIGSSVDMFSVLNLDTSCVDDINEATKSFFSMGIHPWKANDASPNQLNKVKILSDSPLCVAIGECGLDKKSDVPFEKQQEVFEFHIQLSEEKKLPLLIHCVGCFNELIRLKKQYRPQQRWIVHGFRGKPQLANQLTALGIALSFGEKFNAEAVRCTPLEMLFVETDESQQPIREIYRSIAQIKGCEPQRLIAGWELISSHVH